jgi:hypothetical protein
MNASREFRRRTTAMSVAMATYATRSQAAQRVFLRLWSELRAGKSYRVPFRVVVWMVTDWILKGFHSGPATFELAKDHIEARELVEGFGPFVEVHVQASVEECARRDVKGLYEKAFAGEIKGFTGVDDPYEAPSAAEIVLDTEEHDEEASARIVIDRLEELGLLPAGVER